MPERTLTDVPEADVAFHKSLLEEEGFQVEVRPEGAGLFTLIGTDTARIHPTTSGTHTKDAACIPALVANGSSREAIVQAQQTASAALASFPHNGCAANLSALLAESGIDVPITLGAGALAGALKRRGWLRVSVGDQQPGDVGITFDNTPPPGA